MPYPRPATDDFHSFLSIRQITSLKAPSTTRLNCQSTDSTIPFSQLSSALAFVWLSFASSRVLSKPFLPPFPRQLLPPSLPIENTLARPGSLDAPPCPPPSPSLPSYPPSNPLLPRRPSPPSSLPLRGPHPCRRPRCGPRRGPDGARYRPHHGPDSHSPAAAPLGHYSTPTAPTAITPTPQGPQDPRLLSDRRAAIRRSAIETFLTSPALTSAQSPSRNASAPWSSASQRSTVSSHCTPTSSLTPNHHTHRV